MQFIHAPLSWVWTPYTCYYHLYSKADLYACAARTDTSWIHTWGDSQEREFVSMLKLVNGSQHTITKYEQVRRQGQWVWELEWECVR